MGLDWPGAGGRMLGSRRGSVRLSGRSARAQSADFTADGERACGAPSPADQALEHADRLLSRQTRASTNLSRRRNACSPTLGDLSENHHPPG